jgi:hypothetical protein
MYIDYSNLKLKVQQQYYKMNRRVHAEPIIVIPENEEYDEPVAQVNVRGRQRGRVFERFIEAMRLRNGLAEMDERAQANFEANPEGYNSEDDDSDDENINNRGWDAYDDIDRINDQRMLNLPNANVPIRAMPELVDDDNNDNRVNNVRVNDNRVNNDHVNNARVNEYNNLRPGVADEKFWKIIESFNWRNRSDGVINKRDLERPVRNLTRLDEQIFREKLKEYYTMLYEKLSHDGVFDNVPPAGRREAVSHMIALGLQIYNTVLEDATFVYILVEQGDCQSLVDLLPASLQIDLN